MLASCCVLILMGSAACQVLRLGVQRIDEGCKAGECARLIVEAAA